MTIIIDKEFLRGLSSLIVVFFHNKELVNIFNNILDSIHLKKAIDEEFNLSYLLEQRLI